MLLKIQILLTASLVLLFCACDKNDDAPFYSDEDRARCAHIDRDADLGNYLYSICLASPYPTAVTPGPPTQDGGLPVEGLPNGRQGVFTGWINDTIAFQSWNPRTLPTEFAVATLHYNRDGSLTGDRKIWGAWSTWDAIDSTGVGIYLHMYESGEISSFDIRKSRLQLTSLGSLSGRYAVDSTRTQILITRWDEQAVSGTIDAWFYDPDDPSRRVHFSDGWFDVSTRPF